MKERKRTVSEHLARRRSWLVWSALLCRFLASRTVSACFATIPPELTTLPPITTTLNPNIPACQQCGIPPPFTCNLDGFACSDANMIYTISAASGCSALTCPDEDLIVNGNVPKSLFMYYTNVNGIPTQATSALCVAPCTSCTPPPVPAASPNRGFIYQAVTVNSSTTPCVTLSCPTGTLTGFNTAPLTITQTFYCRGNNQWTAGGIVYPAAGCLTECDNCPQAAGYTNYPPSVTSHFPVTFNYFQFQCPVVASNCGGGYALRVTTEAGTDIVIPPSSVSGVMWSCLDGVWTITYGDAFGNLQTTDITNQECYTGPCIGCMEPMVAAGIIATPAFSMTTGCKFYSLSGCSGQYRAAGADFGAGISTITCMDLGTTSPFTGFYGAGTNPMVLFSPKDAIGCDTNPIFTACQLCPTPSGYTSWPAMATIGTSVSFFIVGECAQVNMNCAAGQSLRATVANGTEIIIPSNIVPTVQWTCNNRTWHLDYTDSQGIHQELEATNQQCFSAPCTSCTPPNLANGVTAVQGFDPATHCMFYTLTGCNDYMVMGNELGFGVDRIDCASVAVGSPTSGFYTGGNPIVSWPPTSIITCIACEVCPTPAGYSDWGSTVSSFASVTFQLVPGQRCATVNMNCGAGFALRMTTMTGENIFVPPANVGTIQWTCMQNFYTVVYLDAAGVEQTANVVNQQCFFAPCVACMPPTLSETITAVLSFNPITGCLMYTLSGCPAQFRARGGNFGPGVNIIRCLNVNATNAMALWYMSAGSTPIFFEDQDAISCMDTN